MLGHATPMSPPNSGRLSKECFDQSGKVVCAICLDTQIINGICVAECYSVERRQLYQIRVSDGRACKSWRLQFVVKQTDENGIFDVEYCKVVGDSPLKNTTVELDNYGVVRIKSYVAISCCPHHESYEGKVLWSEEFGRVLAGERDRVERLQVYSTWVERDRSEVAKSYGVDFRICDVLKPVTDESVITRCRKRMMDDQEALHEKNVSVNNLSPPPSRQEMGQATFSVNAKLFAFREGKPRGNGLYAGLPLPKRLRGNERKEKISEYKKKESDCSLLLFTKKRQKFSEAWGHTLGRVVMLDTVFEGSALKEGDWFYASVRLFHELFRDVEPIFMVKKIIDIADPLAYTVCFMDEIQIQIEGRGKRIGSDDDGKVIFEHPSIGNIVMTSEDYEVVRSRRMVCLLQFNHDNPYHKPWSLKQLVREVPEFEEYHDRVQINGEGRCNKHRRGGYGTDEERATASDHSDVSYRYGRPLLDPTGSRGHRCPQLDEALDIIDRLLDSSEIYRAIERRNPRLIHRMNRLVALHDESQRYNRDFYYGSETSSYGASDEESRSRIPQQ